MGRRGRQYLNYLAISFFAAAAVVVLFNALIWQKNRHSAPLLFSRAAPAASATEPRIAEMTAVPAPRRARHAAISGEAPRNAGEQPPGQKSPAGKPAASGTPGSGTRSQTLADRSPMTQNDQISELLEAAHIPSAGTSPSTTKASAPNKSVLAAQHALVKLGFVLKPDGVAGAATRQAIKQFERSRGLPVRGVLSPALMLQLKAEAGIGG